MPSLGKRVGEPLSILQRPSKSQQILETAEEILDVEDPIVAMPSRMKNS
jgi:hypothetical protein